MITSNLSKLAIAATLVAGVLVSVCANDIDCGCEVSATNQCQLAEVKKPTWWGWLTDNKSTQFHFFQLIELIYGNGDSEKEFSNSSPKIN